MKKKRKTFLVTAHLDVYTNVKILADSLEDALAHARDLKLDAFADLAGDYLAGHGAVIKGVDEL